MDRPFTCTFSQASLRVDILGDVAFVFHARLKQAFLYLFMAYFFLVATWLALCFM